MTIPRKCSHLVCGQQGNINGQIVVKGEPSFPMNLLKVLSGQHLLKNIIVYSINIFKVLQYT